MSTSVLLRARYGNDEPLHFVSTMKINQGQIQFTACAARQAFTLVELLVVCAIIVILAGLALFVVSSVAHSSKVTKTRSTIQKLDAAMRQIFETYEDRFQEIKIRIAKDYPATPGESEEATRERQAAIAAHYIRDLMRMEMPQNGEEVQLEPLKLEYKGTDYPPVEDSLSLLEYYRNTTVNTTPSAALLFLIIQNLNPEALEAFHGSEVADTDGDGLLEFVDAWGKPIRFLRWAPAFSDSDIQLKSFPDPTDERTGAVGWFLYPLIYSAGADGKYGLEDDPAQLPMVGDDGILDPFKFPFGEPDGTRSHFDNIHNHQWYRNF